MVSSAAAAETAVETDVEAAADRTVQGGCQTGCEDGVCTAMRLLSGGQLWPLQGIVCNKNHKNGAFRRLRGVKRLDNHFYTLYNITLMKWRSIDSYDL